MDERILTALREKVPVVTASHRLARTFLHQYGEIQTGRGAAAWESPTVLPWTAWLGTLWEEFQFTTPNPPVRLDAWQEWVLWDTVIRHSPQASELLQVGAAVTAIQNSWALTVEWRLDLARIDTEGNDDARTFTHWARLFVDTCESRGWIDTARIADHLRAALAELRLPSRVVFAGFDEFTPQQVDFIDACRCAGCNVETVGVEPMSQTMKVFRAPFSDRDQELVAAARWVRAMLWTVARPPFDAALATTSPRQVTPDMERKPQAIQRLVRDWQLPALPPSVPALPPMISDGSSEPGVSFRWVGDTLRHTGTVVHQMLRRIAADGVATWNSAKIEQQRAAYGSALLGLGVPAADLAQAVESVAAALTRTLTDDRGRWLLAGGCRGAACEYSLSGIVGGELINARIDRTFIDEQGVRWIVDYKSSSHQGSDVESFLDTEQERYRGQLERYRRLFTALEDKPIRMGLYFPLLSGWREVEELRGVASGHSVA